MRRGWWAFAHHDGDAPASPIFRHRGAGAAGWLTPYGNAPTLAAVTVAVAPP
jgi:hypothetical protein